MYVIIVNEMLLPPAQHLHDWLKPRGRENPKTCQVIETSCSYFIKGAIKLSKIITK